MSDRGEDIRVLKIGNIRGLHARASARFVEIVESHDAEVRVSKDGHIVGGSSIMGLLMLAANKGSQISVSASGSQAAEVLDALANLVDTNFGEDQ